MARRRGNGMLLVLALQAASQYSQLERKPPVTAGLIIANVLIYLRPGNLDVFLPALHEACLNPYFILRDWDFKRLFLSAFYHVDESHLVYNMLSLLWKGVQLEGSMGSRKFATMVAVLLTMSHGLVVISSKFLASATDSPQLYNTCSVGFSAVLFALKVVLNHNSPNFSNVYGVMIPSRYAAWAELILIKMFSPESSFLGHLCGIVAGLLYIRIPHLLMGRGSSSSSRGMLRRFWAVVTRPLRVMFPVSGRSHVVGSSSSRERERERERRGVVERVWRCGVCTYDNWENSNRCEICGSERWGDGSGNEDPLLSVDQLREARLARFSR